MPILILPPPVLVIEDKERVLSSYQRNSHIDLQSYILHQHIKNTDIELKEIPFLESKEDIDPKENHTQICTIL